MNQELISDRDNLVIRRLVLEPGEATHWHTDTCHRFTVVIRGERLAIEFHGTDERPEFPVAPGLAGWDAPEPRVHRAVNTGLSRYEEVVTFFRREPGAEPQPRADDAGS